MTLEVIKSDLITTRHGFFTRKGGASSGIFEGLNCGQGSSDQAEAVAVNRSRVADWIGVAPDALVSVHQCHSADVITVDGPLSEKPKADGMVTDRAGIALGILTADCQPVLFHDPHAGIIGATHAGWKGAIDGVLEATLNAMEGLGANRSNINAVIGPSISQSAYEVGPEFAERFIDQDMGNARFFANGAGDRMQFDLPAFGLHCLRQAGVGEAEWVRHCTFSDSDRFYSYRRTTHANEADYGRLISTICL